MPAALELILRDVAGLSPSRGTRVARNKKTFYLIFHHFFGPKISREAI
jgi:hypothetical protein